MWQTRWLLACVMGVSSAAPIWAAGRVGDQATDFPPGVFTAGGSFSLADFEGKCVVLFFYEQMCPTCRERIPARNQVVAQFRGKPVVFFAVAAGDTLREAQAYQRDTRLAMPIFADPLSLMERRYGLNISLQNIHQIRVIGPDGKIVGYSMEPADLERAVADVKWKYKDDAYHEQLSPAIDQLEWNRWEAGMKLLKPLLNNRNPAVAESARKVHARLLDEARQWSDEAESLVSADPVRAFDLYTRVAAVAAGDELGKQATARLGELRRNKQLIDEMAARKAYAQLGNALGSATPQSAMQAVQLCQTIIQKYPDTQVAVELIDLVNQLTSAGSGP